MASSPSSTIDAKIGATGFKTLAAPIASVIDLTHPLFLHPSDTPDLSFISEKMTDQKHTHSGVMAKNKLGFISEYCLKESYDPSMH